jgi:hypothetical protein
MGAPGCRGDRAPRCEHEASSDGPGVPGHDVDPRLSRGTRLDPLDGLRAQARKDARPAQAESLLLTESLKFLYPHGWGP